MVIGDTIPDITYVDEGEYPIVNVFTTIQLMVNYLQHNDLINYDNNLIIRILPNYNSNDITKSGLLTSKESKQLKEIYEIMPTLIITEEPKSLNDMTLLHLKNHQHMISYFDECSKLGKENHKLPIAVMTPISQI